ncbi:MAG: hypothetical protein EBS89_06710 [Proteobacteria bacterium]|nr:hypothetical protein [Pseudomonadota bacterium]
MFRSNLMKYCQTNPWGNKGEFAAWCASISPERLAFVDQVYWIAEKNYCNGGDIIVETFTPREVEAEFKTIEHVQDYCGLKAEQALNARWGSDDDPQLKTMQRFEQSGDWAKQVD